MKKPPRTHPTGIIFGEPAVAMSHEHISVFVMTEQSLAVSVYIQTWNQECLLRYKPAELVKLRDALNQAIAHFEQRKQS